MDLALLIGVVSLFVGAGYVQLGRVRSWDRIASDLNLERNGDMLFGWLDGIDVEVSLRPQRSDNGLRLVTVIARFPVELDLGLRVESAAEPRSDSSLTTNGDEPTRVATLIDESMLDTLADALPIGTAVQASDRGVLLSNQQASPTTRWLRSCLAAAVSFANEVEKRRSRVPAAAALRPVGARNAATASDLRLSPTATPLGMTGQHKGRAVFVCSVRRSDMFGTRLGVELVEPLAIGLRVQPAAEAGMDGFLGLAETPHRSALTYDAGGDDALLDEELRAALETLHARYDGLRLDDHALSVVVPQCPIDAAMAVGIFEDLAGVAEQIGDKAVALDQGRGPYR